MPTKTITIDMDAYDALSRRKRKGQSFSDVIKEHFERGATGGELRRMIRRLEVGEDTLDGLEALIADRGSHPARGPGP